MVHPKLAKLLKERKRLTANSKRLWAAYKANEALYECLTEAIGTDVVLNRTNDEIREFRDGFVYVMVSYDETEAFATKRVMMANNEIAMLDAINAAGTGLTCLVATTNTELVDAFNSAKRTKANAHISMVHMNTADWSVSLY
jgi:hypothetical protein